MIVNCFSQNFLTTKQKLTSPGLKKTNFDFQYIFSLRRKRTELILTGLIRWHYL